MVFSWLLKPSPTRALLIAHLHHASPAAMGAPLSSTSSFNGELFKSVSLLKVGSQFRIFNGLAEHTCRGPMRSRPTCFHANVSNTDDGESCSIYKPVAFPASRNTPLCWKSHSILKQRCFCTSSGQPLNSSYTQQQPPYMTGGNASPHQAQQNAYAQQQPSYPAGNGNSAGYPQHSRQSTYSPGSQTPQPGSGSATADQPGYASPTGPPSGNNSVSSDAQRTTSAVGGTTPGSNNPPRTSAAAEVIDKYLGPSTLKLEKRDEKAPPPPPPPRRNYGAQGTQEKKSGKDLVAESAACAVIEKYLGPWPGFPPRDPKIDEYLDSLPENAACAAIDKYFGPYKPLFVFKKNEENPDNPPPPSRPPRNRMMNRARNRSWNASQQGASVDRPWTAPQQGSNPNVAGSPPSGVGATASQGAGAVSSGAGTTPPQGAGPMPPPHGAYGTNTSSPPQGAGGIPPPQGPPPLGGSNM